jgi:hypothetical protein
MATRTRVLVAVVTGLAMLGALTACGVSGTDDSVSPETASPEPADSGDHTATDAASPDEPPTDPSAAPDGNAEATQWVGDICAAANDLERSLNDLGTSIRVDIGTTTDLSEKVVPPIESKVAEVAGSVSELADAIDAVPVGADPELSAAADDLEANRRALEGSVDGLRQAAGDLKGALSGPELVQGAAAVATEFAVVRLDAVSFADSLRATAKQGSDTVRAAFGDAPSCTGYN